MTAINLFRQRHRASILCDAAAYDIHGNLQGFYAKCAAITHLRAAVATRGTAATTALFAANFGLRFLTFDLLVRKGAAFAEQLFETNSELFSSGENEVEIFIAGWSESRNRPETYFLVSDDRQGVDAWEWHECEPVSAAPVPTLEDLQEHGLDVRAMDAERIDPVADGMKILEAQRNMPLQPSAGVAGEPVHVVGGFALLTEVKADGVTQRVIHRWAEDEIGQLIRPGLVRQEPAPIAAMSRQQRRAAERAAKKGRVAA